MTLITMYDTVEVSTVPSHPQAVAGYVGGHWPTYAPLVAKFPKALHKSIAVNASENADILDVEAGDASPGEAPTWIRRQQARGHKRPGVYANASTMPAVTAALSAAGIKRSEYVMWIAHYTGRAPSLPFEQGADAVQYTDTALGRNLDASICRPEFFGSIPATNSLHYEWFDVGPFPSLWGPLHERQLVENYDKNRKHPILRFLALKHQRTKLNYLAGRVYTVAHKDRVNGKPSWGKFRRGWRYQQLIHRAQGQRFV